MKKLFMASAALVTFAFAIALFQIISCKKSDAEPPPTPCDPVCIVKGTYAGTYTNQYNMTATFVYVLNDNNFTTSAGTITDSPTAFGAFWNSCDSIKITSWNSINSSYYYFAGKFSTDKNTITGIYKNLTTTSEVGTFTLAKQ